MYFCRFIENEVYMRMDSRIRIATKCLDPYVLGLSSIQIAIRTTIKVPEVKNYLNQARDLARVFIFFCKLFGDS